jgi:hypothetical protein
MSALSGLCRVHPTSGLSGLWLVLHQAVCRAAPGFCSLRQQTFFHHIIQITGGGSFSRAGYLPILGISDLPTHF